MAGPLAQTQVTELLIDKGIVDPSQIDEAVQRQVLFGGALDTNLLELGVASEDALLTAMADAFVLQPARKGDFDNVSTHLPRLFPKEFAEAYRLVPLKLEGQALTVAVNGPADPGLFARIKERLQLELFAKVTTEVRLHYAMERLYGIQLLPRIRTLLTKLDGETHEAETPGDVLSWGLAGRAMTPAATGSQLDMNDMLTRLDTATDRDPVVDVLLGASLSVFEFAALFWVQSETVNGFRATDPQSTQRVAQISMPVNLPSVFQTVYVTGAHYLGQLPKNAANTQLLEGLGRDAPKTALLAPVKVGERLAAILYADNGGRGIPSKRVASLMVLSNRAGFALEGIIRSKKRAAAGKVEVVTPPPPPPDAMREMVEQAAAAVVEEHVEVTEPGRSGAPQGPPTPPTDDGVGWETVAMDRVHSDAPAAFQVDQSPEASSQSFREGIREAEERLATQAPAPGHVPFADISEEPEEALDDWEDVLVDAAGNQVSEAPPPPVQQKIEAPGAGVTWNDVILEAQRAATTAPVAKAPQIEVAGTTLSQSEILLDSLEADDPGTRRGAVEALLASGVSLDHILRERFPGRVTVDVLAPNGEIPPLPQCSGLLELLVARGTGSAQVVLPHLDSPDPVKRFFAVFYLAVVKFPQALVSLARRLYDRHPRVRVLAADALRNYSRESGYKEIVQNLRQQLKVPVPENQVSTAQILGQLRDPSAVPSLIPLVVTPAPELSAAAQSALAVICAQAFGADVAQWAAWWHDHYAEPRVSWLIKSLRHHNVNVRRLANTELQLVTGHFMPFDLNAPQSERDAVITAWEAWWQKVQRQSRGESDPASPPLLPAG